MPSLWKKKGKKISRVVVDLPPSPRQRDAFIVENEASNSPKKLFGENDNKLNISSKKKHRFLKQKTTIIMDDHNYSYPMLQTMSYKYVPQSKLEVPISSIIEKNDESIVEKNNFNLGSNNKEFNVCENKDSIDNMLEFYLGNLVIISVVGIILYYKVFIPGFTLVTLFLLILRAGELTFSLCKYCESLIFWSILRGTFVVMVAFNTKWRILGIIIGFLVLILIELTRKIVHQFVGYINRLDFEEVEEIKEEMGEKIVKLVSHKEGDICSKTKIHENDVLTQIVKEELCDSIQVIENKDNNCFEVKIKELSKDSTSTSKSSYLKDEKIWNTIVNEIESLDQIYSIWPRRSESIVSSPDRDCELLESKEVKRKTENDDECTSDIDQYRKVKKRGKFWKKLVPKHMRKSKKSKSVKYSHEEFLDNPEENALDHEFTEMEDLEESSSVSSEENEGKEEYCSTAIDRYSLNSNLIVPQIQKLSHKKSGHLTTDFELSEYIHILPSDDDTKIDIEIGNNKEMTMKWLILIIISLIGLIGGRIFAFVLTLIVCALLSVLKF